MHIISYYMILKIFSYSYYIMNNTQASLPKLIVDDVSSTIDSITDGSTLKKRKLPTNATSSSQNGAIYEIAERVKQRRRPAAQTEERQEITLSDSSSI